MEYCPSTELSALTEEMEVFPFIMEVRQEMVVLVADSGVVQAIQMVMVAMEVPLTLEKDPQGYTGMHQILMDKVEEEDNLITLDQTEMLQEGEEDRPQRRST